jgi:tripartite-type tricarboxylate transporter receptor subunit TctC
LLAKTIVRYLAASMGLGGLISADLRVRGDRDRWMDWKPGSLWPSLRAAFVGITRTPEQHQNMQAIPCGHLLKRGAIAVEEVIYKSVSGLAPWNSYRRQNMLFQRLAVMMLGTAFLTSAASFRVDAAESDAFPSRPIKLVVGFAPGGSSDTVARILAPRIAEVLKQSVVVDNKAGAGGNIASDFLVKAPADGYTIMLGTIGSLAVNQHLNKLAYNPLTDMVGLSMAVVFSNVLVVNATSSIRTLEDYIRQGRLPDSKLSFGSSGVGSSGHLAGELLKSSAGLNAQHVAYRGGAPAMNDLLGGTLQSIMSSPTDALQFIKSGKLRAIATTGSKRLDALPQVPTIAESGYPGFEAINWYAFTAPVGTPPEVVQRLNAAIVTALKDPGVVAQLRKLGLDPTPSTSEQTMAFMRKESEKWGAVVRKAGIKSE